MKIDNTQIKLLYEKFANEEMKGKENERMKKERTIVEKTLELEDTLPLPEPSPIVKLFRKTSTVVDMGPRMIRAKKRKESNIGFGLNKGHQRKQMRRSNSSV